MSGFTQFEAAVVTLEQDETSSGTARLRMRTALTHRVREKQTGQWVDGDTTYLDVLVWGPMGQHLYDSVAPGDRVVVIGRFKQNDWTDKEGRKHTDYEVVADSVGVSVLFGPAPTRRKAEAAAQEHQGDGWA